MPVGRRRVATAVKLRSPAHARPIHGNWTLSIYPRRRFASSDTEQLVALCARQARWGGWSGAKHIWSVYLDAAHQVVDRRGIDTTLDRITQSYAEGFVIFDRTSIPWHQHAPRWTLYSGT